MMANTRDQIELALELLEIAGVNILDGRDIELSIMQHRTAEMKRALERIEYQKVIKTAINRYFERGGIITHLPPRPALGHMAGGRWK